MVVTTKKKYQTRKRKRIVKIVISLLCVCLTCVIVHGLFKHLDS